MSHRIIGFDLARAYAILGMYIVNFNLVFSLTNESDIGQFLQLFNGNSAALFVSLSGMGVALLSNSKGKLPAQRRRIRGIIIKRSWFLVGAGLLLSTWWPADILHFYGGYILMDEERSQTTGDRSAGYEAETPPKTASILNV